MARSPRLQSCRTCSGFNNACAYKWRPFARYRKQWRRQDLGLDFRYRASLVPRILYLLGGLQPAMEPGHEMATYVTRHRSLTGRSSGSGRWPKTIETAHLQGVLYGW